MANINESTDLDIMDMISQTEPQPTEKPISPLAQMVADKEKSNSGLVIDNTPDAKPLSADTLTEDQIASIKQSIDEIDGISQVLQSANIDKSDINSPDKLIKLIDEAHDIASGRTPRTNVIKTSTADAPLVSNNDGGDGAQPVEIDPEADVKREAHEKLVEILIDKTGLGANINLTDEERSTVQNASMIRVVEVEQVEIPVAYSKKDDKSFKDLITPHSLASAIWPVVLHASKYRNTLRGLSFGELNDIALDKENITYDKVNKQLSVIYNSIINTSIGKFASYDDFLKNTAYTDIGMMIYALACATLPEKDSVSMTCNNEKCGKQFNSDYAPRSIIQFDKMDDVALKSMDATLEYSSAEDCKRVHETSSVRTLKEMVLPNSGYRVSIGIASCYDYLNGLTDILLTDKFRKDHPEDVNGTLYLSSVMLTFVRKIGCMGAGSKWYEFTEPEDVIQAIYTIHQQDFSLLMNMFSKYSMMYTTPFAIKDVKCPHCGVLTETIPVDISDLVFLKSRLVATTTIDLKYFPEI